MWNVIFIPCIHRYDGDVSSATLLMTSRIITATGLTTLPRTKIASSLRRFAQDDSSIIPLKNDLSGVPVTTSRNYFWMTDDTGVSLDWPSTRCRSTTQRGVRSKRSAYRHKFLKYPSVLSSTVQFNRFLWSENYRNKTKSSVHIEIHKLFEIVLDSCKYVRVTIVRAVNSRYHSHFENFRPITGCVNCGRYAGR